MKAKRFYITAIAVMLLVAMLGGCATSQRPPETNDSGELSGDVALGLPMPVWIQCSKSGDFKQEIIDTIKVSTAERTERATQQIQGDYVRHRTSSITEFYMPNVEIDGYELLDVVLLGQVFWFRYAPENPRAEYLDPSGNYYFCCCNSGIRITIKRLDSDGNPPPNATIEQIAEAIGGFNSNAVIREGFPYAETLGAIAGQLEKTWFDIIVPDKLNDFEFLRDLAMQVIKSAELVTVR
jgi:hypothetical protein